MQTSGFSAEQMAKGLVVTVVSKKKSAPKKKATKKKLKPKVKGKKAVPLKTLSDVGAFKKAKKKTSWMKFCAALKSKKGSKLAAVPPAEPPKVPGAEPAEVPDLEDSTDCLGVHLKVKDSVQVVSDRNPAVCGFRGEIVKIGHSGLVLATAAGIQVVPCGDVRKAPDGGWKPLLKLKSLASCTRGLRVAWVTQTSSETLTVELSKPDLLQTFYADLAKGRKNHEMEVPMLELWWAYVKWALDLTAESGGEIARVYLASPCRFIAAVGGVETPVEEEAVRKFGVEILDMKKALFPVALQNHWTLLTVDLEMKKMTFWDTLNNIKPAIVEKMKRVVEIFKTIPGLEWLPADVSSCRTHWCRQGADVSCGYFVCWFLEEEMRRSLGECPWSRGSPNVDRQIDRLQALVNNVLPVEKKLQAALKSTKSIAETPLEPAAKTPLDTALEDVAAIVLEKKDVGDVPGMDKPFPIADYDGDMEAWATDVVALLSDDHQKLVKKVREQVGKEGCKACSYQTCKRCWWPKTVRYWRTAETGAKHAAVEGYDRLMKAPTSMKLAD